MRQDGLVPQDAPNERLLVCRAGSILCALPLETIVETLRPLPVETLRDSPPFVAGLTVIRGIATPVVEARLLVGGVLSGSPGRFVRVRVGARSIALAVDAVLGIRSIPTESLARLAPLLGGEAKEIIDAIAVLDTELLLVLRSARLVPDSVWTEVEARTQ